MREPRNPFKLRTAEHIESDTTFLRLFEPSMLELLPENDLWSHVHILRSAPGGGKTSLMRLFAPTSLLTLYAYRTSEDCRELFQLTSQLGAFNENGPVLLGVMVSCARNYAALADLETDHVRRQRLFFSLLSSRIVLAMLRAALTLKGLHYPNDLEQIEVRLPSTLVVPTSLILPCTGRQLYEWAEKTETAVCEAIDSLSIANFDLIPGQETLTGLSLLDPKSILIDGIPVAENIILMLDDVHKLTSHQRHILLQSLLDLRSTVGVWIAERYEALDTDDLLSSGAIEGRDYASVIPLEKLWTRRSKRFEHLVVNIANRRARSASEVDIISFGSWLETSLDSPEWENKYSAAIDVISTRVRALAAGSNLFEEWLQSREQIHGTTREQAIAWRTLEILIERERRKLNLRFDWAIPIGELERRDEADVRGAAELFIAREFDFPYYFGQTRLASIASSNIEQFLWLAGEQFEEIVSAALMKKINTLSPLRQEAILKKAVVTRWNDMPRRVPNGRLVRKFLEAVGGFSRWATYQPNAPYSPGVTGIAISMDDLEKLRGARLDGKNTGIEQLSSVIASAIAHNLFDVTLDYKCKGNRWMVMHLNRLLCVQFNLPLQYSGWKEKSLRELQRWLEDGFRPNNKEVLL